MGSLERSHSKLSNFKLTIISLMLSLFFNLFILGLIIIDKYNMTYGIIISGVSLVFTLFFYLTIRHFTRWMI